MAENLDVNVNVNTSQAQSNINSLNNSLKNLNGTFGALKNLVAGIAFTQLLRDANSFALAMTQVSKSTQISIDTINNFSDAVGSLGGNSQKAVGDVQDFVAGLYDAKQGSASAQAELGKIGITLSDLATLSNEDIFKKTIDGLAKIEDASTRNALAVKMLGKNFKDLDVRSVQQAMASGGPGGGANASAIQAAANAQIQLSKTLDNVRTAFINVLEPLNNTIAQMNLSVTAIESLIKSIASVTISYVLFTRVVPALTATITALTAAFTGAGAAAMATTPVIATVIGLWSNLKALAVSLAGVLIAPFAALAALLRGSLAGALTNIASFFGFIAASATLLLKVLARFAGIVGVIYAVAEAVNFLSKQFFQFDAVDYATNKLKNFWEWGKKVTGLGTPVDTANKTAETASRTGVNLNSNAGAGRGNGMAELEARARAAEQVKQAEQKIIDANRAQALEAQKIVQAYQTQNGQLATQLQFQNTLIGKDEEYASRQTKMFELQTAYVNEINQLRQKYLDMQAAAAVGTDEEKAAFAAFAKVYQSTISKIAQEYDNQRKVVGDLLNQEMVLKAAEKDRQNTIDQITKQMERQVALGDQLRNANDKLKDIQFAGQQMGRSPLEKQFAQIQEDARKAALEAGRAFAAGFEGMDLTIEQSKELADGLEQIALRYKLIADEQAKQLEQSRSFDQGWKDAFDNYMDNATNAAQRAGQVFTSITRNMESAIDNFVETGKFSFSDFARSIIQDMIKIELKAQATKVLGMIGGGGGIFSAIGNILGFAGGGNPPVNKPSLVGENGPELFVPKTAGTVVPNGALNGMNSQPVHNTYITNNISAIDSKSVAQLFAENRKTLLGTVQLAQKELPYGNR